MLRTIEEIRKILSDQGITGYELSKEGFITQPGADKILRGDSNPRKTTLLALNDYINRKLLNGEKRQKVEAMYSNLPLIAKGLQMVLTNTELLLKGQKMIQDNFDSSFDELRRTINRVSE